MTVSPSLLANPRLSRWIAVPADGSIELRVGKVEIGQGIATALVQIAADALAVSPSRIRIVAGRTDCAPDELWTSASISVEMGGAAVHQVCTEVRSLFAREAARRHGVDAAELSVNDGAFGHPAAARPFSYADLAAAIDLDIDYAGMPPAGASAMETLVGTPLPRIDLVAKLRGEGFVHDLRVAGMWHLRVARPPRPGCRLLHADRAALEALPGVTHVVVDGSFVALCAAREWDAVRAQEHAQRHLSWSDGPLLPDVQSVEAYLRSLPVETVPVHESGAEQPDAAQWRLDATFVRPYLAHASIGTCCALAVPSDDLQGLTVFSHSQGVYPLRDNLATALGLPAERVHVVHAHGAGCYGHNGADDVALEAALVARAVGRPVRACWSRQEELCWAPFGPAMLVDVSAGITAEGRVTGWQQRVRGTTHLARPGWGEGVNLLAAGQLARPHAHAPTADVPMSPFGGGGQRNAIPIYAFDGCHVAYDFAVAQDLRTSALRSLGAHANVFAIESMVDDLALAAGLDPLEVRLRNIDDPRAAHVLARAAALAGWTPGAEGTGETGRGIALGRYKNRAAYFAAVVEVELSHVIRVARVFAVVDCGQAVNPDGVRNQVEGGIVQAISWALKEQVRWNPQAFESVDWPGYPILGFDEIPAIALEIVPAADRPPLGVGECTMGPMAAAIGNAVRHAIGVRVRELPITVDRIAALA